MNRHDRRRALATGSALPALTKQHYTGPTPSIRVLLVDGFSRSIKQVVMRMHPDDFVKILGKQRVSWAKLGEIDERIHIMLAGDPSEQTVAPGHRWYEPEFEIADENGVLGPVLRGKAAVFGFSPALAKATSTPVNPIWLEERVRFLDPQQAAQRRLEKLAAATLEDQSGQEGEAEQAGRPGLAALPDHRPGDG